MPSFSNHPSSIDYFKESFIKNGLARPSRYEVQFSPLASSIDMTRDSFPAESVTLPSRGFNTIEEQWYGPTRIIPIGSKYDSNVIITFPVSSNQDERTFFEDWMDALIDVDTEQNKYGTIVSTRSDIKIYTLDEFDKQTSKYTLYEAYPSNIFPISLGANMFNDYTRIQVQFEYRSYTYSKI